MLLLDYFLLGTDALWIGGKYTNPAKPHIARFELP